MIDRNSRYAHATQSTLTSSNGEELRYILPPILPHPEDHPVAQIHRVTDSDRPDTIAARAYGQATAWWLFANANTSAHPDQLTENPGDERVIPPIDGPR